MNTIGILIKKILDVLVGIVTGQGETNSRLRDLQSQLDAAKHQAEITKLDTDARLSAMDEKLDRVLGAVQIPEDAPTALKITLEPGDTRNTGGF